MSQNAKEGDVRMAECEGGGLEPCPVGGADGFFTQKEAAVISALMDYLGLEGIGVRDAVSLLRLVRRIRGRIGVGESRRHEGG